MGRKRGSGPAALPVPARPLGARRRRGSKPSSCRHGRPAGPGRRVSGGSSDVAAQGLELDRDGEKGRVRSPGSFCPRTVNLGVCAPWVSQSLPRDGCLPHVLGSAARWPGWPLSPPGPLYPGLRDPHLLTRPADRRLQTVLSPWGPFASRHIYMMLMFVYGFCVGLFFALLPFCTSPTRTRYCEQLLRSRPATTINLFSEWLYSFKNGRLLFVY